MAVGELFLGAILNVLFEKLTSSELLAFAFHAGILPKLEKWSDTLKMIESVLSDAEKKQNDEGVKTWLEKLRDFAYDVEDILDEFATEGCKLMAERCCTTSTSKVHNLFVDCFTGLGPRGIRFKVRMGFKIDGITSRLEELRQLQDVLGLKVVTGPKLTTEWQRPPSTTVPTEPAVYGRDDDKAEILRLLSRDESTDVKFRVLPIVGMGGIGKTTLAREVYNDEAVKDFHPRAWVCISNNENVYEILKAILQSITSFTNNLTDLNAVSRKLKEEVHGRKFLLVLDDVWSDDYDLWEYLKAPFMSGAPGSRIILTTRNLEVASTIAGSATKNYSLKPLSDDDCWSLFVKHAFEGREIGALPNLESIREKVVAKCGGLPLAARTLGGLLLSKQRCDEWEDILNSEIWNISYRSNNILPVLRLSYYHLPPHLKRCFSYCAILPKNFEFEERELVLLWIAEGFIQESENIKQLEDLGSESFRDLLSRSLFQQSSSSASKFLMHDLVNDLAQSVSQGTCFRLKDELGVKKQPARFNLSRHSSYICGNYDGKNKFEAFQEVKGLRTFLPMRFYDDGTRYITSMVLYDLLPKLKKLRVLSLATYYITKLPNSVGGLIHLRYLNLSLTKIRYLPKSTSLLYNLQILILINCCFLWKLPSDMKKLINLRHLDITGSTLITEMPLGMGELKCLQTLSNFIVGKDIGFVLEELKYLKFLREKLCISNLEYSQVTGTPILCDKAGLKVLLLEWSSQRDGSQNAAVEKGVLKVLQPHGNLEELTIRCYAGIEFPSWVWDPLLLSKMVVLRLESCKNCTCLPSLGLLRSLKDLTIKEMTGIKSIGSDIYGEGCSEPFQSLENLYFEDMIEWKQWYPINENEHVKRFPRLRKLSIKNCPKLCIIPVIHLHSLKNLVILECKNLVVSFSSLPMLCELEVDGCKEMVCSSLTESKSLKSVTLSDVFEFGNWFGQQSSNLTTLKVLCIKNCNALASLPEGMKHSNAQLECLKIEGCHSLTSIALSQLPSSLKRLSIISCEQLQDLVDGGGDASSLVNDGCLLEYMYISECSTLTCLSLEGRLLAALKYLEVWDCPKLMTLSSGQLPEALKHLQIRRCSELATLSVRDQLPEVLEYLQIDKCPKLKMISGSFPNNMSLRVIRISNCENIKYLPDGLHHLSHVHRIDINFCRSFVSFRDGRLPNHISSVSICRCEKFMALPQGMHNLNLLQELNLRGCPLIESFPDEGFPANLTSLSVEDHNIHKSLVEWGLSKLTSLKHLSIHGCSEDAESFPLDGMLPTSLTKLAIQKFTNLKHLSSQGFQNLTSLEYLMIRDCPSLASLPSGGLPSSLLQLYIHDCPLLKKQCKKNKGKEWSKIAHIPCVEIDHEYIYEQ